MKVPELVETKERLKDEAGMTEEDIEEAMNDIRLEFGGSKVCSDCEEKYEEGECPNCGSTDYDDVVGGYLREPSVIAFNLAKRKIEDYERRGESVGGHLEIGDLHDNMRDLQVDAYVLSTYRKEVEDGEKVIAGIIDRTGQTTAILQPEVADDFEGEYGDAYQFKGRTWKPDGSTDILLMPDDGVERLDDGMEESLDDVLESIKMPVSEIEGDGLGLYEFFSTEGLCTDVRTSEYYGCPNCGKGVGEGATKCEKCGFAFNNPQRYFVGDCTIMTRDGASDIELNVSPRREPLPDVETKRVKAVGRKETQRQEDEDTGEVEEVETLRLVDIREVNNGGQAESQEAESEEDLSEDEKTVLEFVEGFGTIPEDTLLSFCQDSEDLEMDEEGAEELVDSLVDKEEMEEVEDGKYEIVE